MCGGITSRNDIDWGSADLHRCLSFDVRDQINVHACLWAMCRQISISPKVPAYTQSLAFTCNSLNNQDVLSDVVGAKIEREENIWRHLRWRVVWGCHNDTYLSHRLCLTLAFIIGVSCVICHWSGVQWCFHMENATMRSPECLSQMDWMLLSADKGWF